MGLQGDLLANSILKKLCQSFYEEDKWQRSLMLNTGKDDEWTTTVTFTMVTLAATSVSWTISTSSMS
jgi:hypothetical protein